MKKDIFLTWQKNIKKVSFGFGMHDFRLIQTPLVGHLKISSEWCPQTDVEQQKLIKIPYSKCCWEPYACMVVTRLDILHAVSMVIWSMTNPDTDH